MRASNLAGKHNSEVWLALTSGAPERLAVIDDHFGDKVGDFCSSADRRPVILCGPQAAFRLRDRAAPSVQCSMEKTEMFSHIMIGSNDIARSRKFYDALFAAM